MITQLLHKFYQAITNMTQKPQKICIYEYIKNIFHLHTKFQIIQSRCISSYRNFIKEVFLNNKKYKNKLRYTK